MNLRKPLYMAAAVILTSFAIGAMSQGLVDGIKVTLPHPVTVGEQVLEPGEYEIRRASTTTDQVLQIYNNDQMRHQTVVITIPTLDRETPEESKVVLHHIGDKYYFDKIWMEGKNYGYEFVLPENVRSLQRELAVAVPATYEPEPAQSEQVAQADPQPAAQQPAAPVPGQRPEAERAGEAERQSAADAAALAERERQAQLEREEQTRLERERIASLQTEQRVQPTSPQSRAAEQEPAEDQLPATASNWLGFVLGGVLLLTLSIILRPSRQES